MKRMIVFLCVILTFLIGCDSQRATPANPFQLKTAVIEMESEDTITIQYHYNAEGFIQQEDHSVNGEHDSTICYDYDAWGNKVRENIQYADGSEFTVEHFITLDENNRIKYEEKYSDTELTDIREISYDQNGNQISLINTIIKPGKDQLINSKMTYDRKGNLIKRVIQLSNDPSMGGTTLYDYEKGRLIREEHFAPAGWTKSYIEYSYDDSGFIQTAMEYNGNGSLQSKTVITCDEYGNELLYEYYSHTGKLPGSGDNIADKVCTYTYEFIER